METNEPKSIAQSCTRMGVAWDLLAVLAEQRGLNPHKVVTPVLCAALCTTQTDLIDREVRWRQQTLAALLAAAPTGTAQ